MKLNEHVVAQEPYAIIQEIAKLTEKKDALQMDLWVSENQRMHSEEKFNHLHVFIIEGQKREPLVLMMLKETPYPEIKIAKSIKGFWHPQLNIAMSGSNLMNFKRMFDSDEEDNSAMDNNGHHVFLHTSSRRGKFAMNVWIKNGGEVTYYIDKDDAQKISDLIT